MELVKLVSEKGLVNVICVYSPNLGCSDQENKAYKDHFEDQVRRLIAREKIIVNVDVKV